MIASYPMKINTEYIKSLMEKQGMNLHEMAYKMDVSESWLYGVLSGKYGKTFATVQRFAVALGVEAKELLE